MGLGVAAGVAIILTITLTADRSRLTEDGDGFVADGEPITFNEFIRYSFYPGYFNGSWWSASELQWSNSKGNLVLWNVLTGETTDLVSAETVGLVSSSASFVAFGDSERYLLFYDNKDPVWRHSFLANYIVLDTNTYQLINIKEGRKPHFMAL